MAGKEKESGATTSYRVRVRAPGAGGETPAAPAVLLEDGGEPGEPGDPAPLCRFKVSLSGGAQATCRLVVAEQAPISYAGWSTLSACVGDRVELRVNGNFPRDATAHFRIWDHDEAGDHDLVAELDAPVTDRRKLVVKWKIEPPRLAAGTASAADLAATGFDHPGLFFEVAIGEEKASSGKGPGELLVVHDVIEHLIVDAETRKRIPGAHYEITLSNGQKRRGRLTEESCVVERNVPPGRFDIEIIDVPPR